MARPRSVQSALGKRKTKTSVRPLLAARWMIAAARFIRSSSETPDGFANFSIKACFSASSAVWAFRAADAFSASRKAICFIRSLAVGNASRGLPLFACFVSAIAVLLIGRTVAFERRSRICRQIDAGVRDLSQLLKQRTMHFRQRRQCERL